jgi:hypothetical protein
VDTEAPRFLDFETWWGSPVLLNGDEMQWIADNLFIGDKLSPGELRTADGVRIDLRDIKSPVICFCSWGDNITPPQQALGWITDLYDHEREIVASGQTIVYSLHQTSGHLGIFVSGKVATKEHRKFVGSMEMINLAPPGLYEAVISDVGPNTKRSDLIDGRYLFRLEPRTLADVRKIVDERSDDDARFAAAARVSDTGLALYRRFVQPFVRATVTEQSAEMMRRLHPNRLRFTIFSDLNPFMRPVQGMAARARENRAPVSADNPFLAWEKVASTWIESSLETWGAARDALVETMFLSTYGSPMVQAVFGSGADGAEADRRIGRDLVREVDATRERASLESRFETGGAAEAATRALAYVNRTEGGLDERGYSMLKELREAQPERKRRGLGELKELVKEQVSLVRLDEERAVAAIPKLLPKDRAERKTALDALHHVVEAHGELTKDGKRRLERVDQLFALNGARAPARAAARGRTARTARGRARGGARHA